MGLVTARRRPHTAPRSSSVSVPCEVKGEDEEVHGFLRAGPPVPSENEALAVFQRSEESPPCRFQPILAILVGLPLEKGQVSLVLVSGSGEGPTLTLWFCSEGEAPSDRSGFPSPFHVQIVQPVDAAPRRSVAFCGVLVLPSIVRLLIAQHGEDHPHQLVGHGHQGTRLGAAAG